MTNNILKEIKNELISKGTEPRIDNLDQYISQNKIFTILFISKIMPDVSSILSSIHAQYSKNSKLKLIICICTDTKEDFDETFSIINDDIPCLIFNYESKMRENLISKFNIITIPSLLILDKDGVLIDRLNTEKIQNLNENIIKGWENIFMIRNLFSQRRKLELGETIKLSVHHHELIFQKLQLLGLKDHDKWHLNANIKDSLVSKKQKPFLIQNKILLVNLKIEILYM